MSENLLQTLQSLVQDVIAPNVRELKVRLEELEKRMDARFNAIDSRFNAVDSRFVVIDKQFAALEKQSEAQFKAILAAIAESKAQTDLLALREVASLRERVAVLEARPH